MGRSFTRRQFRCKAIIGTHRFVGGLGRTDREQVMRHVYQVVGLTISQVNSGRGCGSVGGSGFLTQGGSGSATDGGQLSFADGTSGGRPCGPVSGPGFTTGGRSGTGSALSGGQLSLGGGRSNGRPGRFHHGPNGGGLVKEVPTAMDLEVALQICFGRKFSRNFNGGGAFQR